MEEKKETKKVNSSAINTVGRRKEAIARVRLLSGGGQITVNGKPVGEYFAGVIFQKLYSKPFEVTKTVGKYSVTVKVEGGGTTSQLGAVIHGISRALAKENADFRTLIKKEGLLTRDARVKERRKYGNAQKARAKKQSPKR